MKKIVIINHLLDYTYSKMIHYLLNSSFTIYYYFSKKKVCFDHSQLIHINITEDEYFQKEEENSDLNNECTMDYILINYDVIFMFNYNKMIPIHQDKFKNKCFINIIYNKDKYNYQNININYHIIFITPSPREIISEDPLHPKILSDRCNNDNYGPTVFTRKLKLKDNFSEISEINTTTTSNHEYNDLLLEINKILFLWFNYRPLYQTMILPGNNNKVNTSCNIDVSEFNYQITVIQKGDCYNEEKNLRYKTFHHYVEDYGSNDCKYIIHFSDNFHNFTWLKNLKYPVFGFNRHYTNKKTILFQLMDFQDKKTLLKYINYNIPFHSKIKKLVGYFSQMGSYTRDNSWYQFQLLEKHTLHYLKDEINYDIAFLCFSNFDRFKFCYHYKDHPLFEVGIIDNDMNPLFKKYFSFLIKEKKTIEELSQYMFQICLNGNDWGTSLFWQLLNFNVVFIPYPFEYESIFMYGLEPYEHFVPISNKLFDLEDKIIYMMENIDLCEKIANQAHHYIKIFLNNDCEFLDLISKETIRVYNYYNQTH